MVALANNLKIPVVMIGTPRILKLLQKEFQQAKRVTGEGEVRMDLMPQSSIEWDRFLKALWNYQYTAKKVELTQSMNDVFYEESVGNPFLASILYKVVQDDAIIGRDESFTPDDVRRVSKNKLGITARKRKDMLSGKDMELKEYYTLWRAASYIPPQSEASDQPAHRTGTSSSRVQALSVAAADRFDLSMQDARKLAVQAIGAYPDSDISVQLEYIQKLIQAEKNAQHS